MEQEYCEVPSGSLCFPGSKLPEWFMFQNIGSSMTLKLPPGWFSDNFVGFALCAIFSFQDYHDDGLGLQVTCECELITEDGLCRVALGRLFGWFDGYSGPHCIGSDYLFFWDTISICFQMALLKLITMMRYLSNSISRIMPRNV